MGAVREVSLPTAECPDPEQWTCFDVQSAEVETLEFMAQLVFTIKPKLIVETGTYRGLAAAYMGKSLKRTGRGKLITIELDKDMHARAVEIVKKAGVEDVVECRNQSSLDTKVDGTIDLLFLDSDPSIRVQELRKFQNQITTRTVIVFHDVNSGAHKQLRAQVLLLDDQHELSVVMLPTPRGLAICQLREGRQ
jgi:predicted O-methyltransferase YrrM